MFAKVAMQLSGVSGVGKSRLAGRESAGFPRNEDEQDQG
jgi:hypothetical protein